MDKRDLFKRMAPVAFAAFLGYGAACATQSAVSPTTAQQPPSQYEQPPPGQPAGNQGGYGGQGAAAPRAQFTECFAARAWDASGRAVNSGRLPQTLRIPPGWTPVGGGALGGDGVVILCR